MTTRIYIKGDLSNPRDCELFDADTGQQLMDVAAIQITLDSNAPPYADLRRVNNKNTERVDIVQRPAHPMAGRVLTTVGLARGRSQVFNGEQFEAIVHHFTVQPDGELVQDKAKSYLAKQVADDQQLVTAHDPEAILRAHAERALRDAVIGAIVDPILDRNFAQPKFAQGGIVNRAPFPFTPKPSGFVQKAATCDECKGTGQVQLFNKTVPCSKGCKP